MNTEQQTVVWKGAPMLEAFLVPIDSLKEPPVNPNEGDVPAIMLSLERWGQERAVTLHNDAETIIAGNHVTKAARKLGWTHIAAIQGHFADDEEAMTYLLADNHLADIGTMNNTDFVQLTMHSGFDLKGTGITIDHIEDAQAAMGAFNRTQDEALEAARERSEDDEAAAARAAMIDAYQQSREVVMLMSPEEYERFMRNVGMLKKEYGLEGIKDTIVRAVESEAFNRNQGVGPDLVAPSEEPEPEATEPIEATDAV